MAVSDHGEVELSRLREQAQVPAIRGGQALERREAVVEVAGPLEDREVVAPSEMTKPLAHSVANFIPSVPVHGRQQGVGLSIQIEDDRAEHLLITVQHRRCPLNVVNDISVYGAGL